MKIGIFAFFSEDTVDPASTARRLESLGFESLWVPEHAIIPVHFKVPYPAADGKLPEPYAHFPDPFVLLGIAAGAASKLKLGTAVCLVPERDPLVMAKEVATLDHFSGGRVLLGVGAGWLEEESEIMGVPFKRRWAMTREYLRAMKELWTKPEAAFQGEFVSFPEVKSYPKPKQKPHPPILIGAGGLNWRCERAVRDSVEYADGWMPVAIKPQELALHLAEMRRLCEQKGRDFSKLDISVTFLQQPQLQPADPKRALKEYAEVGVQRLILCPADLRPGHAERTLEDLARSYLA